MDKNTKLTLILFLLVVISIFIWSSNLKILKKASDEEKSFLNFNPVAISSEITSILNLKKEIAPKVKSEFKEWGDNPFSLDRISSSGKNFVSFPSISMEENFVIQGIFLNDLQSTAIINDRVLGIGDAIKGYTVKNILPDKVILTDGTKEIEASMTNSGNLSISLQP